MDDLYKYLQEMYGRVKQTVPPTDKLDEIVGLLKASNRYPDISTGYMEPGTYGEYNTDTNKVRFSDLARNPLSTATHEMFHALDNTMGGYYGSVYNKWLNGDPTLTDEDKRFYDTYKKLDESSLPFGQNVEPYRKSYAERRAFGVGNYAGGGINHPTTPHQDATNASEMAILMDMYKRALNAKKPK